MTDKKNLLGLSSGKRLVWWVKKDISLPASSISQLYLCYQLYFGCFHTPAKSESHLLAATFWLLKKSLLSRGGELLLDFILILSELYFVMYCYFFSKRALYYNTALCFTIKTTENKSKGLSAGGGDICGLAVYFLGIILQCIFLKNLYSPYMNESCLIMS